MCQVVLLLTFRIVAVFCVPSTGGAAEVREFTGFWSVFSGGTFSARSVAGSGSGNTAGAESEFRGKCRVYWSDYGRCGRSRRYRLLSDGIKCQGCVCWRAGGRTSRQQGPLVADSDCKVSFGW